MTYRRKKYSIKKRSIKKTYRNKKTARNYLVGKKYNCKKGGGGAPSAGSVKLPMLIDKNNVAYSCSPIATS